MGGCKADRVKAVKLLYPLSDNRVEPNALTFRWKTEDVAPVRLVFGTTRFTTVLLDTTLTGNVATYGKTLQPDLTYTWRIEQGEHVATSTFKVMDIAMLFDGHYAGTVAAWNVVPGDTIITNSTAEIDLQKIGDAIWVSGAQNFVLEYATYGNMTMHYGVGGFPDDYKRLTLDYGQDSIHLFIAGDGRQGWHRWLFDAAR